MYWVGSRRSRAGSGWAWASSCSPITGLETSCGKSVRSVPLDRLYLGVGSGSGPGAMERVAQGIRALQSELDCCLVVAALGPRMCRLAGAEADGVLIVRVIAAVETVEHVTDLIRAARPSV